MSVGTCAINGLYSIICRDPDTAAGGTSPSEAVLHAPGFLRHVGEPIDELAGQGMDRKVQIMYDGTKEWLKYGNSQHATRMRNFGVTVRIGYFAGSHVDQTMAIMADDEQAIAKAIAVSQNWPACTGGCVNGYIPGSSDVINLDDKRYILELSVAVQVTG